MPTGIPGFDQLLGGGLPRERITLLVGGPGCGKTLFALQTVVNGARDCGEPAIFVAFEERTEQLFTDSATLGWNLPELRGQQLFFLDAHLPESVVLGGEFDLGGLLAALEAKVDEMGATRIVFDGIDMLLGALDNPVSERREIFRISDWVRRRRLSAIVTCKTSDDGELPRRHEIHLPYLADCVVTLRQQANASMQVRRLRVSKCRGIGHSGSDVPFTITTTGLQVATYPTVDLTSGVSSVRISTGVPRLDTMLDGGYFRGSSILVSGSPGTAKSTLAASFAESAARRGEPTLYVSFDERGDEIVRNMRSVGIDLAPLVRSGHLFIEGLRREDRSSEEHVAWIGGLIRSTKARCMVVDPASALSGADGKPIGDEATARLMSIAKASGITLLMTSLVVDSDAEISESGVSTVADTWIHVSYLVLAGERNRALTIIKARGTHHSNQVRELILSEHGVELADVYLAGGAVLMGTMRWQKEIAEQSERAEAARRLVQLQKEAELAAAEARARLATLQIELAAREAAVKALEDEQSSTQKSFLSHRDKMRRLRTADGGADKAKRPRSNGRSEVSQ